MDYPKVKTPPHRLMKCGFEPHRRGSVNARVTSLLLVLFSFVVLLADARVAYAHVRYVLTEEEVAEIRRSLPTPFLQDDLLALVMLGGLLVVVAVQFLGLSLAGRAFAKRIEGTLRSLDDYVPLLLRVLVGAFLMLAGAAGRLFSPERGIAFAGLVTPVSILQLTAGALLIMGFLTKIGALLLVLLVAISFAVLGVYGLDQFVLLGVAAVLFFEGGLRQSIDAFTLTKVEALKRVGTFLDAFKAYSMPTLRIMLGVTLIWLGLTEKLLVPELTEAAVLKYNVPFFPELRLFVLSFGFFEILLGAHYLLGIFNRLISFIYLGLLVYAFFLFGEGANHLHLFAVTVAFLIRGAGPYRMHIVLQTKS